jgi:hypothetical protein
MARLDVKYIAIDPYYLDQKQTFIGINIDDCWLQKYHFERWLGREHSSGISTIYKIDIIQEKL